MQQEKEINLTLEIAAIFSLNDSYLLGTRCNYNDWLRVCLKIILVANQ